LGLSYSDKNTGKTDWHIPLPKSPKSIHKLYPLSHKPVTSLSKGAINACYDNRVIEQVVKDAVKRSEIVERNRAGFGRTIWGLLYFFRVGLKKCLVGYTRKTEKLLVWSFVYDSNLCCHIDFLRK